MTHDYSEVFETNNEYWERVLEIFEANEKFPKKKVTGRHLHHKFPRSFSKKLNQDVDNDKDNLISLSPSDHFLVHYYYYKVAKKGFRSAMALAFRLMARDKIKFISAETAEAIAKDYEQAGKDMGDSQKSQLGKSPSKEHRMKISKALIGKNKGRVHTQETRNNMSKAKKGKESNKKDKGYSEFGILYLKHFGYSRNANVKQYTDEYNYYNRHGKVCSWQ